MYGSYGNAWRCIYYHVTINKPANNYTAHISPAQLHPILPACADPAENLQCLRSKPSGGKEGREKPRTERRRASPSSSSREILPTVAEVRLLQSPRSSLGAHPKAFKRLNVNVRWVYTPKKEKQRLRHGCTTITMAALFAITKR